MDSNHKWNCMSEMKSKDICNYCIDEVVGVYTREERKKICKACRKLYDVGGWKG